MQYLVLDASRRGTVKLAVALSIALAVACSPDAEAGRGEAVVVGDPGLPHCGIPVIETEQPDPCLTGTVVLPDTLVAIDHGTTDQTFNFSVPDNGVVCVAVRGEDTNTRVLLDGDTLLMVHAHPSGPQTTQVRDVTTGTHALEVIAHGHPGATTHVEVRFVSRAPATVTSPGGFLRVASSEPTPPFFSPSASPGTNDTTTLHAAVGVDAPRPRGGRLALRYTFHIIDASSCELVAELVGSRRSPAVC